MPKHHEIRKLSYPAHKIYELIANIELYPEFLPWCKAARIIKITSNNTLLAELVIGYRSISSSYISKVTLIPPEEGNPGSIEAIMEEGPFHHLYNRWIIMPLNEKECNVEFTIDFSFKSALYENIMGIFLGEAIKKIGQAFEDQAKKLIT